MLGKSFIIMKKPLFRRRSWQHLVTVRLLSRCKAPFVSAEIELFIFPSLLAVLQVFVLVDGNFVIASTLPILRQYVA